ncbi:helix-turn-helix domain-containing protein [Lichenihabitans psoromatis]|uniref:helix-turn-helix domain-containing protein n=1 Tax=Lichenihabitans psoromatis TaxID=2528642 RepID=UPI0010384278|nr:helix-turn-helix transcriptional regulator [Lichenihabitans psoromatis]
MKPHVVGERIARFLRAKHPNDTAKTVARLTGLPSATISKWLERSSAPSAGALITLLAVYEAELFSAVCPGLVDWVEQALALSRDAALREQIAANEAQLADVMGRLRGKR